LQQVARHEFGKATPVVGGMQTEIENAMRDLTRDTVARRPQPIPAGGSDAKSLVERISAASIEQIDEALQELQNMRAGLLAHNERIRMEIAGYENANEKVSGSLKSVSDILAQWRQSAAA
jgi:hypothetical protein